jgi:hypothetical protein
MYIVMQQAVTFHVRTVQTTDVNPGNAQDASPIPVPAVVAVAAYKNVNPATMHTTALPAQVLTYTLAKEQAQPYV